MSEPEIEAILEAIKKGLEGNVIDRITITINPKATSKEPRAGRAATLPVPLDYSMDWSDIQWLIAMNLFDRWSACPTRP